VSFRRAARIDANQPQIVAALRSVGASVQSLSSVGLGVPDLLVGWQRRANFLLEVKDPAQDSTHQQLTEAQKDWHARWRGQVVVVKTIARPHRAGRHPARRAVEVARERRRFSSDPRVVQHPAGDPRGDGRRARGDREAARSARCGAAALKLRLALTKERP